MRSVSRRLARVESFLSPRATARVRQARATAAASGWPSLEPLEPRVLLAAGPWEHAASALALAPAPLSVAWATPQVRPRATARRPRARPSTPSRRRRCPPPPPARSALEVVVGTAAPAGNTAHLVATFNHTEQVRDATVTIVRVVVVEPHQLGHGADDGPHQ